MQRSFQNKQTSTGSLVSLHLKLQNLISKITVRLINNVSSSIRKNNKLHSLEVIKIELAVTQGLHPV